VAIFLKRLHGPVVELMVGLGLIGSLSDLMKRWCPQYDRGGRAST
jgi:hypothetical protein